jgi:hypothetical protein
MHTTEILLLIFSIVAVVWIFFKIKFSYWKSRGVPFVKPRIPYGNIQGMNAIQLWALEKNQSKYDIFNRSPQKVPLVASIS